ncbi:ATP-binding cassette domain-containing protein, partial [Herbaspirillum sp. NPDC087042]|uniref:ATP-binding cassette domain-containing protein n=1 Tax=Herbaspirillum sp. NPDC087042 TaxID=3364004 RepID=UPI0037F59803
RDLITSSTATALADLPFFLLFLFVFWLIGGVLVFIPLVALLAMLLPGLLAQRRLARLANASMRESSLRNAMLVESIQGLDEIKALQAEARFERQWNQYNAACAHTNLHLRTLTNGLVTWTQNVQGAVFAVVIVIGAPMVIAGDLTTGSLVAASMLSSRMMAPLAQLTHVLTRWQQAKVALKGLDKLMQSPVDHPEGEARVHLPAIRGEYRLRQANFRYDPEAPPVLNIGQLDIQPGERIAVLGRNGAGKSTLFRMLAGRETPDSGELVLGPTVKVSLVDQSREDLGNKKTVFEDVSGGADILTVGRFEMPSRAYLGRFNFKGGDQQKVVGNLSGGERGRLHLAKTLLQGGNVLLLDEPSNDLDVETLRALEDALLEFAGTVLVISHDRWFLDRIATHIIAFEGDSQVTFFDGNYQEYEADKKKRLGEEAAKPKRIRYKPVTR